MTNGNSITPLAERLLEILPISTFASHRITGVTNSFVYSFKANCDVRLVPFVPLTFPEVVAPPQIVIRRTSKRKKEFFTIASIEKILSKS